MKYAKDNKLEQKSWTTVNVNKSRIQWLANFKIQSNTENIKLVFYYFLYGVILNLMIATCLKKVAATCQLHDMLLWRYRKSPLERQKFSEVKMALILCILFHQYTEHHVYILIGNNFRIMFHNIKLLTEYLIIYNVWYYWRIQRIWTNLCVQGTRLKINMTMIFGSSKIMLHYKRCYQNPNLPPTNILSCKEVMCGNDTEMKLSSLG